jgi:hypothetical protein
MIKGTTRVVLFTDETTPFFLMMQPDHTRLSEWPSVSLNSDSPIEVSEYERRVQ